MSEILSITQLTGNISVYQVGEDPQANPHDIPAGALVVWQPSIDTASQLYMKFDSGNTTNVAPLAGRNNLLATGNPSTNDDVTQGYSAASLWVNTVNNTYWRCFNNTAGAAEWALVATSNKFNDADFQVGLDGEIRIKVDIGAGKQIEVGSEAEMLALPVIPDLYIVIRSDLEQVFYLDALADPAILANWAAGPSIGDRVIDFTPIEGFGSTPVPRAGRLTAQRGDYTAEQIPIKDSVTGSIFILEVRNGVPGIRQINDNGSDA